METEENALVIFSNPMFGKVETVKIDGEPWFVGKDIAEALDYKRAAKAVVTHVDEEDRRVVPIRDSIGRMQNTQVINESGMYSLVLRSKLEKAKQFKHWVTSEVLPSIRKTGKYSVLGDRPSVQLQQLQDSFDSLTAKLDKIGLLKPMVNYRYSFEKFNVFYKNATGDDSPRGIHEACGDYYGFPVPYSKDISITLRDYVLIHISNDMEIAVEELEKFVMGITSGTIVKSSMGHWVNLNGFGGNNYEWPKVLREFNHKCAYCGRSDVPLIPEHIVPQSVMSKEHPERVDLIGSIVCSCGSCNASKGKQDMELWYRKHPKFSVKRLQKIKKHQLMYSLDEL